MIAAELFGAGRPALGARPQLSAVPPPYRRVVRRCLQTDRDKRYPTASAVVKALQATDTTRRRVVVTATLVLLLTLAGGLAYTARQWLPRLSSTAKADGAAAVLVRGTAPLDGSPKRAAPAPIVDARPDFGIGQAPDAPSPARRRRYRRVARPQVASRDTKPTQAGHERDGGRSSTDESARAIETISRQLEQLERRRRTRGFLVEDLSGYALLRRKLRRALQARDIDGAKTSIAHLTRIVDNTRIDKRFVARKLEWLNKLPEKHATDKARQRRIDQLFSQVHDRFFAGDYEGANRYLNNIWHMFHSESGPNRR